MGNENRVSFVVPPEAIRAARESGGVVASTLKAYLIALTPEERRKLLKMGDKSLAFVEKISEYATDAPEFVPAFLDVVEMKNDLNNATSLNTVYRPLVETVGNLSDTILASGSDAYKAALLYYTSVKSAAKNNVPNAKAIYEDLRKRFESQGKTVEPSTTATPSV